MAEHITRRRLVYVAVGLLVVLTIVSFALPQVGGGSSHITNIFP